MFKKEISVFSKWKEDNEKVVDKCLTHDAEYWKIDRLISRNPQDKAATERVIEENFLFLKDIYIELSAQSAFPLVSQICFADFCIKCKMIGQHLNLSDIDRHFLASLYEENVDHKQNNMCRFMFLEALVRIADSKYRQPGLADTYAEALERLIHQDITPHWGSTNWMGYRLDWLWQVDVNDTFQSNILGMR